MEANIQTAKANLPADKEQFIMKVGDKSYTDKKEAGTALVEMCREMKTVNVPAAVGEYDDHEVDLQNRYQEENADYEFINRVANTKAGDDADISDTDAWAMIEDPKADVFDTFFPEKEVKSPELQQLEEFMKLLTPDQINLIYEHYGAGKTLKQICDEENAANGTDKSPQSVGNRKKKILERLKKLFEKAEK